MQMYPTKDSTIDYFGRMRWGDTVRCVRCGNYDEITPQKATHGQFWCKFCREYFNAFTNTPLERNKIDQPQKWLYVSYLLMTARSGITTLQLKAELKVTYNTAWYILHRLRVACGCNEEVSQCESPCDETCIPTRQGSQLT